MKPSYYLLLTTLFIFNTTVNAEQAAPSALEPQTNQLAKEEPATTEKNNSTKPDTFSRAQHIGASFGLGVQKTNLDFGSSDEDERGFATSIKGNYGVTNHLLLGFIRNVSFFERDSIDSLLANELYNVGLTGLSATYYLKPSFPSAYGIIAVGATQIDSTDADFEKETGGGFLLGGGLQASERLQLEVTHIKSDIDDINLDASTTQLTLNYVLWIDL